MNLGISSKEKRLTGLHQNQNFGQVALEFYLAEALSNLPEFASLQTMKFESTYKHNVAAWMVVSGSDFEYLWLASTVLVKLVWYREPIKSDVHGPSQSETIQNLNLIQT